MYTIVFLSRRYGYITEALGPFGDWEEAEDWLITAGYTEIDTSSIKPTWLHSEDLRWRAEICEFKDTA